MSNEFVTAKQIAERALPQLIEEVKLLGLVQTGVYDASFTHKAGDTIQIKKPTRGSVVDGSGDISGSIQAIKDESVEMTLNIQDTYPVEVTSKELLLNIDDMNRQIIMPAVSTLAESINGNLAGLYKDIPYFSGTAGTTPSTLKSIAEARKNLQVNNAPKDNRSFVFDADAEVNYLSLDSLVEVDKSGTPSALRSAVIGRVYEILMVSDNQIKTHTAGGYTALADVDISAGALGATTISVESTAGAAVTKLLQGDLFTLDGNQYVVTADTANAIAGDIAAVSIYPALPKAFGDMTDATLVFVDETQSAHIANMMFQKDAFALAMASLPEVPGANNATVSYGGFSIRVVSDYDFNNDKALMRFDVLYGVKTTYPELATIVLG